VYPLKEKESEVSAKKERGIDKVRVCINIYISIDSIVIDR